MRKILTWLTITTIFISSSYAYTATQIQKITPIVWEKIENIINKKITKKYKKLDFYLLIKDKLNYIATKRPKYKDLIKAINNYLQKDYLNELWIIPITIDYVVDWDTIRFINKFNWKEYSLRMVGIDTPESNKRRFWYAECYWDEAKKHLKELTKETNPLYVKYYIEKDKSQWDVWKYWRQLWYLLKAVKYKNWQWKVENLNWKQIKDWYAWEYTYNKYHPYIYQNLFKQYQKYAESRNLGLWSPNTCNWQRVKKVEEKTSWDLLNILNYPTQKELQSWVIHQWDSKWNCPTTRVYCSKIQTCDEAYYYLNQCWASYLDRNKDWVPCESLCKK